MATLLLDVHAALSLIHLIHGHLTNKWSQYTQMDHIDSQGTYCKSFKSLVTISCKRPHWSYWSFEKVHFISYLISGTRALFPTSSLVVPSQVEVIPNHLRQTPKDACDDRHTSLALLEFSPEQSLSFEKPLPNLLCTCRLWRIYL